jgi:hypothetical protein
MIVKTIIALLITNNAMIVVNIIKLQNMCCPEARKGVWLGIR